MEKIQSTRIISRGGLNNNQNYLELSELAPGYSTMLINFESALTGGYRRINGYQPYSPDYEVVTNDDDPAEGPILGVFGFHNSSNNTFEIYACRKLTGVDEYGFYLFSGSGWTLVNTGTTQVANGVSLIRAEVFNFGVENIIIFVDGVNKALAFDGSTWYQYDSAHTGGDSSPGGAMVLDAPALIANFKNTVFFAGDPSYPGVVAFSAPNDPYTWTASAGAGQQVAGFEVQQIKPFRDELFIFGFSRIKKSIPDLASGFVLQDVTTNLGCIARDSVFELAGNLIFLSHDGLRIIAGTARIGDVELGTISQNIQESFSELQELYNLEDLRTVVIRDKTQFRYFFSDGGYTRAEGYGLLGSFRVRENAYWEFGELNGIRASCCWSGYDGSTEVVIHGDYNGKVYRQDVGNSFDGDPIYSVYRTPYLDFGDTEVRKTMRTINTFIKATGSFNISISAKYDWDNIYITNPANYNENATADGIIFDGGFEFDDDHVFAGSIQPIFKTNIQGSGYSVQFTYVSNGIYAPFTIQGFVVELSPNDRI